jgi:myo-inositol-1-phosphate synthase
MSSVKEKECDIMNKIKIAIIGIGNCASSLVQGIEYYKEKSADNIVGVMHYQIGAYKVSDIEVVAAFDIDRRKVGLDINQAMFSEPNCTKRFQQQVPISGTMVSMGKVLDGYAFHMDDYADEIAFRISGQPEPDKYEVVNILKNSGAEILVNYLPVGSQLATEFYMDCAIEAGLGVVNCIPVFIASEPAWEKRFSDKHLPIIGDDIKSQFGATILHRIISETMRDRGIKIERSYQLNTAGNTDFLNMLERRRLKSKKISKTEAVQSVAQMDMYEETLHVGPSDFVPWQKDNKVCFIRIEAKQFGNVPMYLDLRLSVEDSPNSAGVVIDAIRCCKLAKNFNIGGNLIAPSAYFCKHPAKQINDSVAFELVNVFIDEHKSNDKREQ